MGVALFVALVFCASVVESRVGTPQRPYERSSYAPTKVHHSLNTKLSLEKKDVVSAKRSAPSSSFPARSINIARTQASVEAARAAYLAEYGTMVRWNGAREALWGRRNHQRSPFKHSSLFSLLWGVRSPNVHLFLIFVFFTVTFSTNTMLFFGSLARW